MPSWYKVVVTKTAERHIGRLTRGERREVLAAAF